MSSTKVFLLISFVLFSFQIFPVEKNNPSPKKCREIIHSLSEKGEATRSFNEELLFLLVRPIESLELHVRIYNTLKFEDIYYIGDIVSKPWIELLKTPNIGKKQLRQIAVALEKIGLYFDMIEGWPSDRDQVEILVKKFQFQSLDLEIQKKLIRSINTLKLSTRIHNIFKFRSITYIGNLVSKTRRELQGQGLGQKSLSEIESVLSKEGLYLGMVSDWPLVPKQLRVLVKSFQIKENRVARAFESLDVEVQKKLVSPIESLNLPTRIYNAFQFEEIEYVGDIVSKTEEDLFKLRGFSDKSLNELNIILSKEGLYLEMVYDWPVNRDQVKVLVEKLNPSKK